MTNGPSIPDIDKLVKICGMLGSSHDGEVLSAARAIQRSQKDLGWRWQDILSPYIDAQCSGSQTGNQHDRGTPHRGQPHFQDIAYTCLEWSDALSSWENAFLESILRFNDLSPKQQTCLDRIADKCMKFAG